ncbi:predicted protein [Chaetoceros tenuissimus]|uniref:Uncharacterized protein n=1 Tax=Chaetoceros tenuissimus TaxID=426638 RepID=A0AAD3HBN3_9STRA|nr:predicted protein [Chaetoceros tenuissimus]
MEDLAKDRNSKLQLVASGRDYQHPDDSFRNPEYREVLCVSAPVVKNKQVFKVSFFDNFNRTCMKWEHLEYEKEHINGVVGFIDGFLRKDDRSEIIKVVNTELDIEDDMIHLETRLDEVSTRLNQIQNAVASLCGK